MKKMLIIKNCEECPFCHKKTSEYVHRCGLLEMKIVDIKTYAVENPPPAHGGRTWIFVKLTTDNGIEGIGEPVRIGFDPDVVVKMIHSAGERFVIDSDPFKIEEMWRKIYMGSYRPGAARMGIISGFEMACWDIIGKALGQPIYNLLGGQYVVVVGHCSFLTPKAQISRSIETPSHKP